MESRQEGATLPPQATAHLHLEAQGCQDTEVVEALEDPYRLVLTMEHLRLQLYQAMEAQPQLLLLDHLLVIELLQGVTRPPLDTVLPLVAVQPPLGMELLQVVVQPPQDTVRHQVVIQPPLGMELLQVVVQPLLGMELLQVVVQPPLGMELLLVVVQPLQATGPPQVVLAHLLPNTELHREVLEPQVQCRSMEHHKPLQYPVSLHTMEEEQGEAADKSQGNPVTRFQRQFLSRFQDSSVSRWRDKCQDRIVSRLQDRVVKMCPERVVRVSRSSFLSSSGGGSRGLCVRW